MRNPFKAGTAASFFWKHAGFSYDPRTETPEQGRKRCAQILARVESAAVSYSFQWEIDEYSDSSDFSNESAYSLWQCTMRDESGEICGSLGGIDFGPGGEPWGDPYRRVIEAELASEEI